MFARYPITTANLVLYQYSKKSIDKQIAKYTNFEELVNDYKKYQVVNSKIDQIMSIEKLNDEKKSVKKNIHPILST